MYWFENISIDLKMPGEGEFEDAVQTIAYKRGIIIFPDRPGLEDLLFSSEITILKHTSNRLWIQPPSPIIKCRQDGIFRAIRYEKCTNNYHFKGVPERS
jgi:hypothetical protein